MQNKHSKSFTLIELLVVVALIALLASIVVVSLQDVRAKARDARRKSDLDEIRKALFLYATDHDGLPTSGFGYGNGGNGWATNYNNGNSCYSSYGDLEDFLDGTDPDILPPKNFYIKMPHDPKCGGCSGCNSKPGGYMYYHDRNCAVLFAHLEKPSPQDLATCSNLCLSSSLVNTVKNSYGMNYCVEIKY